MKVIAVTTLPTLEKVSIHFPGLADACIIEAIDGENVRVFVRNEDRWEEKDRGLEDQNLVSLINSSTGAIPVPANER